MWKRYKCIYISGRWQSEKATSYMIPSICHFREGKIKKEESQRLGKGGDVEYVQHRGFPRQWEYSLWYYIDGYLSLYCPNSLNGNIKSET